MKHTTITVCAPDSEAGYIKRNLKIEAAKRGIPNWRLLRIAIAFLKNENEGEYSDEKKLFNNSKKR